MTTDKPSLADREFICRFWIGYWQGRLLVLQGFGKDVFATNGNGSP